MTRTARLERWVPALLVVSALACEGPLPTTGESSTQLDDLSVDELTEPVTGSITGEAFEAADVYFRVFRQEDRERVDLVFADVTMDDCGLPLPREGRRVFLRFDGTTTLPRDGARIDRDSEGDVSVHYERQVEGHWIGVGVGIAELALDFVGRSTAEGRVHACFDDGQQSCVKGAFTARACLSRLDGYLPREGTGTAEPPRAAESVR